MQYHARPVLIALVAVLLVAPLRAAAPAPAPAPARAATTPAAGRPNIVLIISDDQGWNDFGFMGSTIVQTPNLDRLAARSAVFPNGYVPTSLCRASLATLLTGLYGSQHKICCNDFPPPPTARQRTRSSSASRRCRACCAMRGT